MLIIQAIDGLDTLKNCFTLEAKTLNIMGAWGTGISSNDTYADIYEQFIDLYNDGYSVTQITEQLINNNQETINLPEDATNFWFAIANAQWECKELEKQILNKVEQIVNTGEDLNIWKELDASVSDLKAREKVSLKFLAKIRTEKEKPRKRTKKKLYNSIFKKGDCLTYVMDNGNYGGAFVLTDEQATQLGINFIAITTINKVEIPTLLDFKNADIYVKHRKQIIFKENDAVEEWGDEPEIGGFFADSFKKEKIAIDVIAQLPIHNDYVIRKDRFKGFAWGVLKRSIPYKAEYIRNNGEAKQILKLNEWTDNKTIDKVISGIKKLFN